MTKLSACAHCGAEINRMQHFVVTVAVVNPMVGATKRMCHLSAPLTMMNMTMTSLSRMNLVTEASYYYPRTVAVCRRDTSLHVFRRIIVFLRCFIQMIRFWLLGM